MADIRKEIIENRILPPAEYRKWLENKLKQHGIDRNRLVATVIVVERALSRELERNGSTIPHPFYKLYNEDGKPTRAWVYAAELALWLKYNGFKATPYVQSIVSHSFVRKRIKSRKMKKQIPLNVLFPTTRKNIDRLRTYSSHFRSWLAKH